jgi:hypothetical protein
MRSRHRPALSACGHLLHGVVVFENRDDGRSRPLASALVSVAPEGGDVASTVTRRDGSYSIAVGSCKRSVSQVRLRVERVGSCEKMNATRIVKFEMGSFGNTEGLLWQGDVKVRAAETSNLCEVIVDSASDQETTNQVPFFLEYEQELKRVVSGASIFFSLMWGFVLLWAIAKWTTVNQPRRVYQVSDDECSFSETQFAAIQDDEEKSVCANSGRATRSNRMEGTYYHEDSCPHRVYRGYDSKRRFSESEMIGRDVDKKRSVPVNSGHATNTNRVGGATRRENSQRPPIPKSSKRRFVKMVDDDSCGDV